MILERLSRKFAKSAKRSSNPLQPETGFFCISLASKPTMFLRNSISLRNLSVQKLPFLQKSIIYTINPDKFSDRALHMLFTKHPV